MAEECELTSVDEREEGVDAMQEQRHRVDQNTPLSGAESHTAAHLGVSNQQDSRSHHRTADRSEHSPVEGTIWRDKGVSTVTYAKRGSTFALRRSTLDFCLGGQLSFIKSNIGTTLRRHMVDQNTPMSGAESHDVEGTI